MTEHRGGVAGDKESASSASKVPAASNMAELEKNSMVYVKLYEFLRTVI
jgi:hypothetical protein